MRMYVASAACLLMCASASGADLMDASTLQGKVLLGDQGWFNCDLKMRRRYADVRCFGGMPADVRERLGRGSDGRLYLAGQGPARVSGLVQLSRGRLAAEQLAHLGPRSPKRRHPDDRPLPGPQRAGGRRAMRGSRDDHRDRQSTLLN